MIKIATIGTSSITKTLISEFNKFSEIQLIACYSRDIDKANAFKNEFGFKYAFNDYEAMLNNNELNTVYIASINSLHYSQAKLALEHNKHVICEKPFTTNTDELNELVELAKNKNLILFEAIPSKFTPGLNIVKENLAHIGKISNVIVNFSQYSSKYPDYKNNINIANVFKSQYSGGALSDIGIYNIQFLCQLFGKPIDCTYFANLNAYEVDMSGQGLFKYNGFSASYTCSKDTYSENFVLIQGDEGHIKLNNVIQNATELELRVNKTITKVNIASEHSIHYYEIDYFVTHFNNIAKLNVHLEESMMIMEIFEKLKKQALIKDCYSK